MKAYWLELSRCVNIVEIIHTFLMLWYNTYQTTLIWLNLWEGGERVWQAIIQKNYCILLSEDLFYLYRVNSDEMQQDDCISSGLHCLQKYSFKGFPTTKG